jgi:hypothetical protein
MDNVETSSAQSVIQYHKVKVQTDTGNPYWDWCCSTLVIGTWKMMIGLMGSSATYCFEYAEDATAFKLRFGL